MKFSKLSTLFKNCGHIGVTKFDGDLWLGGNGAYFRIEGDIRADDKGLCSLLNIPEKKQDEVTFIRDGEEVMKLLKQAINSENQIDAYPMPIGYIHHDKTAQIYATEQGAVIFNRKLIDIASTDNSVENLTQTAKFPMLSVWDGILKAVIMPMQCLSERELTMLERFTAQAKLARDNELLLPSEPEQMEMDDYPF